MMSIERAMEMVCQSQPLYRPMMMALEPVETDAVPTMGTDGVRLLYNSKFLAKLTSREAAGVCLHEMLHCAYKHLWRRDGRDFPKFNVAADYAINPVVTENFPLPKGCLIDMKYADMSAEEIYDVLPKMKEKKSKSGKGKGSGYGSRQQKWGDHSNWSKKKKKKGKQSLIDKMFGRKPKGDDQKSGPDRAETARKWKELFEENIVKNYGKLPASLKRTVEKEYYIPTLDWGALVSSLLSEDQSDYSFNQPDRRFLDAEYILPDLYSIDRLKDVVFAYDTSGSISSDDLRAFYMETLNLFNNFSSLQGWIAVCDTMLYHFTEISSHDSFEDFNFQGGGGTDFRPIFKEIEKRYMKPKALFYFTDTYGDFPEEEPSYPVFWLVQTRVGHEPDVDVPFGTVIPFTS